MTNIIQQLAAAERAGKPVALCTIIASKGSTPRRAGSKMLVYLDGLCEGTIGGGEMESRVIVEALEALKNNKPRLLSYSLTDPGRGDPGVCGGQLEVYVEPIQPEPTIVIIGAGHVGQAVAHGAKWLGLRVIVCDDREGFATPELFPDADETLTLPISQLPEKFAITPFTYLILTTRNVSVDLEGLPALLETPAAYIGVIGSRRRWQTTHDALIEKGVPEEKLARVVSPLGLEINAETPEEIALSILAEVIQLHRGGDGRRMGA